MIGGIALAAALVAAPAEAGNDLAALDAGRVLETALATCDQWMLYPMTWESDARGFPARAGLEDAGVTPVDTVPDFAAPPLPASAGLHHWKVQGRTGTAFVTTSHLLPVCHIAAADGPWAAGLDALLATPQFATRWKANGAFGGNGLGSRQFVSTEESGYTMIATRPDAPGGKGVQALISTQFRP